MYRAKVMHIVEAFGGGVYTMVTSLINRICDEFDVYLVCAIRPQTPKDYRERLDDRIKVIEMRHAKRSIGLEDILNLGEIRKLVRDIKPDLIHLHSSKAGFVGRWAINMRKYKVLYTPHSYSFLKEDDPFLKRRLYYCLERMAATKGGLTVCCSEGEWKLSKKVTGHSVYINNGIDMDEGNFPVPRLPRISERKMLIATVGRICPQKRPWMFEQIACGIQQHDFLWIGDGEERAELKSSNIHVTGWLERKDALEMLNQADIFVLFSAWEGLSIALLEAMYMKKICIVAPISGLKEVVQDGKNGFWCETPEHFFQIIREIENGKWDWRAIVQDARYTVEQHFTAQLMCDEYKRLYCGLLDGR